MIRVLLVSPLPPPDGGISKWTRMLVDRGIPGGIQIEVINTNVKRSHFSKTARPTPSEMLRNWRILTQVRSAVHSGRFDVMHLNHASLSRNGMFRDYLIGRIASAGKLPYVVQLHGTLDLALNRRAIGKMRIKAYRGLFERAAAILPVNTPTKESVLTLDPSAAERCEIVPHFITSDQIQPRNPDDATPDRPFQIVYAGSLVMAKGLAELLAIAQRVDDVHLTLIGQAAGKREQRYMEFFQDPRIAHRVTLTGHLPNREVLDILMEADVYCLPSHTEGFPMSIMEAMQAGLPVVASNVGAIPDMVDVPQGGILCTPRDTDRFIAAIEHLRDFPEERREMGNHNRTQALSKYDYDDVVRRLADVYLRAAAR